jgi:hypothetical protein
MKTSKIYIPKPCNEDWNKMTSTSNGKFCDSCCKNVVDFTTMTNEEVQAYLSKYNTGNVCGRFTENQAFSHSSKLHRKLENFYLTIENKTIPAFTKSFCLFMLSVVMILIGTQQSQATKPTTSVSKNTLTKKDVLTQLQGEPIPRKVLRPKPKTKKNVNDDKQSGKKPPKVVVGGIKPPFPKKK